MLHLLVATKKILFIIHLFLHFCVSFSPCKFHILIRQSSSFIIVCLYSVENHILISSVISEVTILQKFSISNKNTLNETQFLFQLPAVTTYRTNKLSMHIDFHECDQLQAVNTSLRLNRSLIECYCISRSIRCIVFYVASWMKCKKELIHGPNGAAAYS